MKFTLFAMYRRMYGYIQYETVKLLPDPENDVNEDEKLRAR